MKAEIYAYAIPGSLTTNEYPLVSGSVETVTTDWQIGIFDNVKMTDDFEQTIILPRFENWRTVTMLRVIPYGTDNTLQTGLNTWYWVTGSRISSISDEAVELDIEFNPVTSYIHAGTILAGYWNRCPTNYTPYRGQAVLSGAMGIQNIIPFATDRVPTELTDPIYETPVYAQLFWVQITTTIGIITAGSSIDTRVASTGMNVYGFPISVLSSGNIYALSDYETINPYLANEVQTGYSFPRLDDFLSNTEGYGFTTSEITDISIVKVIPYTYTAASRSVNNMHNLSFRIKDTDGTTDIDPVKVAGSESTGVYMYHISDTSGKGIPERTIRGTLTISAMQHDCGSVGIRDSNGSIVGDIPTAWFDSNHETPYTIRVHADYGQIYYHIGIGSQDELEYQQVYQIPCSHLPYLGTPWDTYRAYSQSFDRESLQYSIEQANSRLQIQVASQAANTLASGNITGLTGVAMNAVTAAAGQRMSNNAARFNQNLMERRIQAQPATVYNTGYGLSYIRNLLERSEGFVLMEPKNLTNTIYNNFIQAYGYQVEGYQELTIGIGFYQGTLTEKNYTAVEQTYNYTSTATDIQFTGLIFDRINEAFQRGIRFINVEGL